MVIYLDVSVFNYLDRPIFDLNMNGTDLLGAAARGFYGASGVLMMQRIVLGPQNVSWRLAGPEGAARNGERVVARNQPLLNAVPERMKWLGLHIYPDETVEIKLSGGAAEDIETKRGRHIIEEHEAAR